MEKTIGYKFDCVIDFQYQKWMTFKPMYQYRKIKSAYSLFKMMAKPNRNISDHSYNFYGTIKGSISNRDGTKYV